MGTLLKTSWASTSTVSELFGEDSSRVRFRCDGKSNNGYVPPIEVHTVRPAFRAGREGGRSSR